MNDAVPVPALAEHAFLRGMPAGDVAWLARAAVAVRLPADHRLFDEGTPANKCWLVTSGHVALDLNMPGRANLIIETLGRADVLGFSWLSPPH
jgi:CRP/FNR family transcriptional regulator, cyclic AMP receptor protein